MWGHGGKWLINHLVLHNLNVLRPNRTQDICCQVLKVKMCQVGEFDEIRVSIATTIVIKCCREWNEFSFSQYCIFCQL